MSVHIQIIAIVGGAPKLANIHVESINWIPMNAKDALEVDTLPHYIVEVCMGTDKGHFRQVLPTAPVPRTWLQRVLCAA